MLLLILLKLDHGDSLPYGKLRPCGLQGKSILWDPIAELIARASDSDCLPRLSEEASHLELHHQVLVVLSWLKLQRARLLKALHNIKLYLIISLLR
jgi:hypothetical protein